MQLKLVFLYFLHPSQTLRQNWDQKKTLKQNLQNLGLAFDANAAVPIPKRKVKVSSFLLKCFSISLHLKRKIK